MSLTARLTLVLIVCATLSFLVLRRFRNAEFVRRKSIVAQSTMRSAQFDSSYYRMARLISSALRYSEAHNECLPSTSSWEKAITPFLQNHERQGAFVSPLQPGPRRFAMNSALSRQRIRVPQDITSEEYAHVILFFEQKTNQANASGSVASITIPGEGESRVVGTIEGGVFVACGPNTECYSPYITVSQLKSMIARSLRLEKAISIRAKNRRRKPVE